MTVSDNDRVPPTRRDLREWVAESLGEAPAEIGETDDLIDAGLDSIRLMSFVGEWRRRGFDVNFADFTESPTIDAWWSLLSVRAGGGTPATDI